MRVSRAAIALSPFGSGPERGDFQSSTLLPMQGATIPARFPCLHLRPPTPKLGAMFGIRQLLVIIAVIAVILIVRRLMNRSPIKRPPQMAAARMVRCAHCGLYLPSEDAVRADGLTFCSIEHRDRHAAR